MSRCKQLVKWILIYLHFKKVYRIFKHQAFVKDYLKRNKNAVVMIENRFRNNMKIYGQDHKIRMGRILKYSLVQHAAINQIFSKHKARLIMIDFLQGCKKRDELAEKIMHVYWLMRYIIRKVKVFLY